MLNFFAPSFVYHEELLPQKEFTPNLSTFSYQSQFISLILEMAAFFSS
jgi:hypothetical protein